MRQASRLNLAAAQCLRARDAKAVMGADRPDKEPIIDHAKGA
jgi:hypothetical protein